MKKSTVGFIGGCFALALIAGSFAFYTSTNTLDNRLKTVKYGETATEKFTPDLDWQPGEEIEKKYAVKNTGDASLIVRIKLDENWWRDNNTDGKMDSSEKFIGFASTTNGTDITTYTQNDSADGLTSGDKSVVEKTLASSGWTYKEGYWYYNSILAKGAATNDFMTAIKLKNDADLGKKIQKKYWTESEEVSATEPTSSNIGTDSTKKWVELAADDPVPSPTVTTNNVYTKAVSVPDPDKAGYADAIYDLFITCETVQATKEAVTNAWNLSSAPTGTSWNLGF